MANKFSKGEFTPTNWDKYVGDRSKPIIYRSSWEYTVMRTFDQHPNVVGWASEPLEIPYQNPMTGRWTVYVPDFMVVYVDKNGKNHSEMIEVKPMKERPAMWRPAAFQNMKMRLTEVLQAKHMINHAKWVAATKFCLKRGMTFRLASEDQLFATTTGRAK